MLPWTCQAVSTGSSQITRVKTEVWVCSAKVAAALQDYKGDLLLLGTCHKHNSWGRKGRSELMFILMLFVALLKQLPGWFWPQVLTPKTHLCVNTTCMVEHTTSHCCHCVTFLSFIMWQWGCQAGQMADMCAQHPHFIALINKIKAFPPLMQKLSLLSYWLISVLVISRWYCL